MSAARKSMLLMVAFVGLWAAVEALASTVLAPYSPYQVVWTRYAVHLAFMVAVWGWREPASLWRTQRPWFQSARSMLMLGMPASWALATQSGVASGTLMAIFWLSPLLILAFGRIFLGERAAASVWLVSGIACIGAMLLTRPGPLPSPLLLVFPLGMAVTFSLYVVMTRSLRGETSRTNLFYTALGVFVVLTPWMPHVWLTPSPHDLAVLIGVGLLGYLTLLALDRFAAAAPVSVAAPLAYLQLAFALAFAAGMGSRGLGISAAAGLLLIVGAAVCIWARAPRQTVREAV
jgi:drug/metabolite transporter (DMT)-like permease